MKKGQKRHKGWGKRPPAELDRKTGAIRIPLTKGKWAIIDAEDYPRVALYMWVTLDLRKCRRGLMYAYHKNTKRCLYLHRFIMNATKDDETVDHKDGDGLNCRKGNMRVRTDAHNKRNRRHLCTTNKSGYNNIFWDKQREGWRVEIGVDRKSIYVGRFKTIREAIKERDKAKVKHGY